MFGQNLIVFVQNKDIYSRWGSIVPLSELLSTAAERSRYQRDVVGSNYLLIYSLDTGYNNCTTTAPFSKEISKNGRRGTLIGRVDGRGWALMRREAAVRCVIIHSRTILRVFRCVPANVRVWVLETCVLCAVRGSTDGEAAAGRCLPIRA